MLDRLISIHLMAWDRRAGPSIVTPVTIWQVPELGPAAGPGSTPPSWIHGVTAASSLKLRATARPAGVARACPAPGAGLPGTRRLARTPDAGWAGQIDQACRTTCTGADTWPPCYTLCICLDKGGDHLGGGPDVTRAAPRRRPVRRPPIKKLCLLASWVLPPLFFRWWQARHQHAMDETRWGPRTRRARCGAAHKAMCLARGRRRCMLCSKRGGAHTAGGTGVFAHSEGSSVQSQLWGGSAGPGGSRLPWQLRGFVHSRQVALGPSIDGLADGWTGVDEWWKCKLGGRGRQQRA
jgi:hypothetical protein